MITPEPVPEPPRRVTLIDTTLGDTAATTSASDPVCVAITAGVRAAVVVACAGSLSNGVAPTPPTTPLESIKPSTPATMATRLPPPGRRGAAVAACAPWTGRPSGPVGA